VHPVDPRRLVAPREQRGRGSGLLQRRELGHRLADLAIEGRELRLPRGGPIGERLDLVVWKVAVGVDAVVLGEAGAAGYPEAELDALVAVSAQIGGLERVILRVRQGRRVTIGLERDLGSA
jgi:hypothetical protein